MTSARCSLRTVALAGLPAVAIVAAVFIAYWPAIHAGFVFDDTVLITENRTLAGADGLQKIWTAILHARETSPQDDVYEYLPLTNSVFFIERSLWPNSAVGFHALSILLHAITSILVWRVLRKLRIPGAWLAALLFAVHPVAATSVAWVSEQKNLWGLLFALASLWCYLEFRVSGRYRWYGLALIAFALGLLGKTSIVPLPVILLLCIWWQSGRIRWKDCWLTLPFFALSLAAGLATIAFQFNRGIGDAPIPIGDWFERFKGAGYALWFYAGKELLPINLSFIYPKWDYESLSVWPAAAIVLIGVVLWWYRRSWARTPLFAFACFVIVLLPVLGFVKMSFMRFALVADHFQYSALPIAMASVSAIGALIAESASSVSRWAMIAVVGVVLALFGTLTWHQASVFKDSESLWTETVSQNPAAAVAQHNLAKVLAEQWDLNDALSHFAEATRLEPSHPSWHCNYGMALLQHGDMESAVRELSQSVRLKPDNVSAQNSLALALNDLKQYEAAREHAAAAVTLMPNLPQAHFNLGNSLAGLGDLEAAVIEYERADRIAPRNPYVKVQWAKTLNQLGRSREAAELARAALTIEPTIDGGNDELAIALRDLGETDQAILRFKDAIRLNPKDVLAHTNLADLFNRIRRSEDAAEHARMAIQLDPNLPEAHFNLGNAYALQSKYPDAAREFRAALRLRPAYPEARANLRVVTGGQSE